MSTSFLLHPEVQAAVLRLQSSLRSVIVSAGLDPRRPQEVHRQFSVDRVLCWKLSNMVKAPHAEAALRHLPGEESFEIFLAGAARAGAGEVEILGVRETAREVFQKVDHYVGGRPTLELMLDSVPDGRDNLLVSRKLAFRGNSGLWGVQARARTELLVLAPGELQPDMVTTVQMSGWLDFKRLRPNAPWRLFKRSVIADTNAPTVPAAEAVDRSRPDDEAMLMHDFCVNMPELLAHREGSMEHFELGPSAAGAVGEFTVVTGRLHRNLGSRWAAPGEEAAEFGVHLLAPAERFSADLLVHRSLASMLEGAEVEVYSAAFGNGLGRSAYDRMPLVVEREELGSPPRTEHPVNPNHAALVAHAMARAGWQVEDFIGLRFELAFPPFPSVAVLRIPLERRGG